MLMGLLLDRNINSVMDQYKTGRAAMVEEISKERDSLLGLISQYERELGILRK
jgi:hypothetical protein